MTAVMSNPSNQIGGDAKIFSWLWRGQTYPIAYETKGEGLPILLLPAFSTVSSRSEMRGLADHLFPNFKVVALDWLGFGESARPALDYQPTLYNQLLQDFVEDQFSKPVAVIAAGHSAGYVLGLQQRRSQTWSKIVLVAPTWKGPLRVMGVPDPVRDGVRELVRSPGVGQLLYALNTTPGFLKFMYQQHVYVDETHLTADFIDQKYKSTQQPDARYAPAAFVTGTLDPIKTRESFIEMGEAICVPVLVVIGEECPDKSKAEMEALAELSQIQSVHISGSLGLHEEYAREVAEVVLPFLDQT